MTIAAVNHDTGATKPFSHWADLVEQNEVFGRYIHEQAEEIVRLLNEAERRPKP